MPMAIRTFDELKPIKEEIELASVKRRMRKFFDEMEIPEEEKDKRYDLALRFYHEFSAFLIMMSTFLAERQTQDIYGIITFNVSETEIDELITQLVDSFNQSLTETGIAESVINQLQKHIVDASKSIIDTTIKKPNEFAFSSKRAELISEIESNTEGNFEGFLEAVAEGYTTKTWVTMRDSRVRNTHRKVDDETIGIFDTFKVGDAEMRFPLDWEYANGHDEELDNCRCHCEYQ